MTLAIPRGRLEAPVKKLLADGEINIGRNGESLISKTDYEGLLVAKVRSFDVATFVAFGGADLGIVGNDVLEEFSYPELYELRDLQIGTCRLSVAASPTEAAMGESVRIATKYPRLTTNWLADRNIQADCIKLNGAIEIAPELGLCSHIVDLVDSGRTLKAHNLEEKETIMQVSAHLIANRTAWKVKNKQIKALEARLKNA